MLWAAMHQGVARAPSCSLLPPPRCDFLCAQPANGLALIKLVRFILRRQYSSALDPSRVQVFYDKWMLSVEKVPQFKGAGRRSTYSRAHS